MNPKTGGNAAVDDPSTWNSHEVSMHAVSRFNLAGVGFVFTGTDPFSGVDLDDCRNPETGEIAPWAWEIIRALDSYSGVSPSGKGVKVFVEGKLPGTGKRTKVQTGAVEIYSRLRYFTVTGQGVVIEIVAPQDLPRGSCGFSSWAPRILVSSAPSSVCRLSIMAGVPSTCWLDNQSSAISEYAKTHNFQIVQTYSDEARCGIDLVHRPGLRQLLDDVMSCRVEFRMVLVYDISRWGRFQATDESAHWEFLCKSAGVLNLPAMHRANWFGNLKCPSGGACVPDR